MIEVSKILCRNQSVHMGTYVESQQRSKHQSRAYVDSGTSAATQNRWIFPTSNRYLNHMRSCRILRLNVYLINYRSKPSGHSGSTPADIAFVFLFRHSTGIREQPHRSNDGCCPGASCEDQSRPSGRVKTALNYTIPPYHFPLRVPAIRFATVGQRMSMIQCRC